MNDLIKLILDDTAESMDKAIAFADNEFTKIRAGKAMPSMLDGIYVEYYGSATALAQVSAISTPDARTLVIQPWEKTLLKSIEKAIVDSNIGLNPQNDGNVIRLLIPPLTEERRRDLAKKVKDEAERGRIAIRNLRKDANEQIRNGVSEDEMKDGEGEVQRLTDRYILKVDKLAELKEQDIMTV